MTHVFHACAGRLGYATELRAETERRARTHACTRSICSACGLWHIDRRTIGARIWAAVRHGGAA